MIGGNFELRYYPSGKTLRGFYVAPNFSVSSLSAFRSSGTATTIGVLMGWQWFPGDDFALGLGIGIDRYILSKEGDYDFSSYSERHRRSGSISAMPDKETDTTQKSSLGQHTDSH